MNNTTTLAATFVAITMVLGLGVTTAMAGGPPGYTVATDATATEKDGSLKLSVTAGDDLPRFPDNYIENVLVFGFAWADLDTGNVILATIHPYIGRDSYQNPDAWHIHPGLLGDEGQSSDFCVMSLGTAQGGLRIKGDTLSLNVETSQTTTTLAALDGAVGFTVVEDLDCTSTLGVNITAAPVGFS